MVIECKNVSKKFGRNLIINGVNIRFDEGKIYGLCGNNGSGKSVFLKLLCGFYVPSSGEILYDGVNFNKIGKFCPDIRAQIESPSFFPDLTGFENLKLLAEIQNKTSDKEILEALDIVNLLDEKDKKFNKYSLGMKQKLGIAQAIMEKTSFIILDESFNGIERSTVDKIISYLKLIRDNGCTIVISSHILDDLDSLVDEMLYMEDGIIKNESY